MQANANLVAEGLITMVQAAQLLPRRKGNKCHTSTVVRWILHGHRGVKLEGVRAPAGWMTTTAALDRFLRAVTAAGVKAALRLPGA